MKYHKIINRKILVNVALVNFMLVNFAHGQHTTVSPTSPLASQAAASTVSAKERITGVDLPQLLGVWYGEYVINDQSPSTEMWLEISFQKPVNGYEIHGYNRWNVISDSALPRHGATSLGKHAQQFDTVSGRIMQDGQHIDLWEDHSRAKLKAVLLDENQMQLDFQPTDAETIAFSVNLQRIDPQYTAGQTAKLGIDISHHSGAIEWAKVIEQGFAFAYVKASEGIDNPDAMFPQHWSQLQSLDFPHGAYHFFVTEDSPSQQALFFASRLKEHLGNLPPVVDIELLGKNTHGDMSAALLAFLQCFERETGVKPMIYTTAAFWDKYYRPEFSDYPLWLSEVGVKLPKVPFGWKHWTLWQNKVNRTVPGVEKNADISVLHPQLDLDKIRLQDSETTQ